MARGCHFGGQNSQHGAQGKAMIAQGNVLLPMELSRAASRLPCGIEFARTEVMVV